MMVLFYCVPLVRHVILFAFSMLFVVAARYAWGGFSYDQLHGDSL